VNWRWIARNWSLVGGTLIGLFFVGFGLYGFLLNLNYEALILGEVWAGIGVIFLALVAVNAWRNRTKDRQPSN
jgi:uncharacterized membrane protein